MAKMKLDEELIRDLARLLEETGLTEIEVRDGDQTVRVGRGAGAIPYAAAPSPAPAAPPAGAPEEPGRTPPIIDEGHPGAVNAPMVGTVYIATDPQSPPFVKVGDMVEEGQTLLLIEAMKTFNEIKAPLAGRVAAILVENGTPVEYGEVLMIVE